MIYCHQLFVKIVRHTTYRMACEGYLFSLFGEDVDSPRQTWAGSIMDENSFRVTEFFGYQRLALVGDRIASNRDNS